MPNCMKLLLITWGFSLPMLAAASTEFLLTEASLKTIADKGSPQLDQIQASFLASDLQRTQNNELFAPELFGRAAYSETNERAILQFIPVWSPLKQAQLGVRQNLKYGFTAEAAVITDQRTASTPTTKYNNITSTTLSFTMQMDMWRDLLGRISKAKLETVQLDSQRAKIEREIQNKSFIISLRRIYWSLVANQEFTKISEEMLAFSQKQAKETKQRFQNSVAEVDELARNEAQVATKKAQLLFFQYQKESQLRQLKTLLPELIDSDIVLAPYDLSKAIDIVTACSTEIALEPRIPYQNTQYDEATAMIRKVKAQTVFLNSRYADPEVKLYGRAKATGVGSDASGTSSYKGNYGSSITDIESTNRTGYEVGINVVIPLGDAKAETQRTKELYDDKRLSASIDASDAQVINTHQQLIKNIVLLNEVIRAQTLSSQQLERRLKFMQKKYQQARVSINDLIQDQDALLRANLTTIEAQLQVLNALFDYLVIYTETPCSFNRI